MGLGAHPTPAPAPVAEQDALLTAHLGRRAGAAAGRGWGRSPCGRTPSCSRTVSAAAATACPSARRCGASRQARAAARPEALHWERRGALAAVAAAAICERRRAASDAAPAGAGLRVGDQWEGGEGQVRCAEDAAMGMRMPPLGKGETALAGGQLANLHCLHQFRGERRPVVGRSQRVARSCKATLGHRHCPRLTIGRTPSCRSLGSGLLLPLPIIPVHTKPPRRRTRRSCGALGTPCWQGTAHFGGCGGAAVGRGASRLCLLPRSALWAESAFRRRPHFRRIHFGIAPTSP